VVAATLALLGTGVVLIALGEERSRSGAIDWVGLHQAMFVVFAVVAGLHVLARLMPALALTTRKVRAHVGLPDRVSGGLRRLALLGLSLAVAALATVLLLPLASDWGHGEEHDSPPGISARH
jgi:hypothetical protein